MKRVTLFAGHYGSGKTNLAVNYAIRLARSGIKTLIADLDIVNPYFRTRDSETELDEAGVKIIVSPYANSNVDVPALPDEMYAVTDDKGLTCVLDIGGDDRGALVLGRLRPGILEENDYENLLVINRFRPLTADAASTVEVMREIELASGIPFTGIINNSNLGAETTAEDVLSSLSYAKEVSKLASLPIRMTTVKEDVAKQLYGKVDGLFPLTLQPNFIEKKIQ